MNKKFLEVPNNIFTGKDIDYLNDMFKWNYEAYKNVNNFLEYVEDNSIKDLLDKSQVLFDNNMEEVLSLLAGGGDEDE